MEAAVLRRVRVDIVGVYGLGRLMRLGSIVNPNPQSVKKILLSKFITHPDQLARRDGLHQYFTNL